jgi:hypothetical protein
MMMDSINLCALISEKTLNMNMNVSVATLHPVGGCAMLWWQGAHITLVDTHLPDNMYGVITQKAIV